METKIFTGLSIAFALTPSAYAGTIAVPNTNPSYPVGTTADGPFNDGEMSRILLINASQLTPMIGKTITGVAWKIHALETTTWPSSTANYLACDLYFGPGVAPANKSLTLLSNYVGTRTQVRSGPISFAPGSIPTGSNFHSPIAVTPYIYTGGHLIFEHRRRGFYGVAHDCTGVRQTAAEYSSAVASVRTGTYAGLTGVQHNAPVMLFTFEEPTVTLSGTVGLQNFIGTPSSVPVQIQVFPAGSSTPVHSQMVTLGTAGAYTVSLPSNVLPGTFDVAFNGSPFLRSAMLNQSLSAGSNTLNFSLRNGDVDDSTEVDAVDIDAVIAAFGNTGNVLGDVDGSLEVDAVDIDIVIANFGNTDD